MLPGRWLPGISTSKPQQTTAARGRFAYERHRLAIACSRVGTGRTPSAVLSSSNFPASHLGSELGPRWPTYRTLGRVCPALAHRACNLQRATERLLIGLTHRSQRRFLPGQLRGLSKNDMRAQYLKDWVSEYESGPPASVEDRAKKSPPL